MLGKPLLGCLGQDPHRQIPMDRFGARRAMNNEEVLKLLQAGKQDGGTGFIHPSSRDEEGHCACLHKFANKRNSSS